MAASKTKPDPTPVDETPGETPPEEAVTATLSPEEEEKLVDKAVRAVKELIDDVRETVTGKPASTGDDEGGGGPGGAPEPPEPSTSREVEADAEDKVRAAVERITAEKEHAAEHAKLKELERPPQQFSRLTRALWGDE